MDNASAALRCRLGRGSCDASPSCRRRNPPCRPCRPFFCRFDRLTVENRSRWAGLASHTFTQGHVQLGPDRLPDPITLKLAKDVVDRRARRKAVARQVAPGAAGAQQIENGVHRRSHVGLAWSATWQCRWDQRFEPRPFRVPQVARIGAAVPPINPTVFLRPHHCLPIAVSPVAGKSCHPASRRGLLGQALRGLAENALDRVDGNPVDPGDLGGHQARMCAKCEPGTDVIRSSELTRASSCSGRTGARQGSQNTRFPR